MARSSFALVLLFLQLCGRINAEAECSLGSKSFTDTCKKDMKTTLRINYIGPEFKGPWEHPNEVEKQLKRLRQFVIILPDFPQNGSSIGFDYLRKSLAKLKNLATLEIDYTNVAPANCFMHMIKPLAECLTNILKDLVAEERIYLKNVHIIGHGVGARLASEIASLLPSGERIGRITGLNPTKTDDSVVNPSYLSNNDADFVDVYHTETSVYGYEWDKAHLDVFIEGDKVLPLLKISNNPLDDHNRAVSDYALSILGPKGWLTGYNKLCTTYFPTWKCIEKMEELGYFLNPMLRGSYNARTSARYNKLIK